MDGSLSDRLQLKKFQVLVENKRIRREKMSCVTLMTALNDYYVTRQLKTSRLSNSMTLETAVLIVLKSKTLHGAGQCCLVVQLYKGATVPA